MSLKSYNFLAEQISTVEGYVEAETEEEAIEKIKGGDYYDIIDSYNEEINPDGNIEILGYEEVE